MDVVVVVVCSIECALCQCCLGWCVYLCVAVVVVVVIVVLCPCHHDHVFYSYNIWLFFEDDGNDAVDDTATHKILTSLQYSQFIIHPASSFNSKYKASTTNLVHMHQQILVLLVLTVENAKGTISECCQSGEIFLLVSFFPFFFVLLFCYVGVVVGTISREYKVRFFPSFSSFPPSLCCYVVLLLFRLY